MLTVKDFLTEAINTEKQVQKLYEQALAIVRDIKGKKCLKYLIRDQQEHQQILEGILSHELYDIDCEIPNNKVFESIQKAYGDLNCECDENSTIEHILEVALRREYHAKKQYEELAKLCTVPEMAQLLRNIAKENEDHYYLIEKEYKIMEGTMGDEF